MRRWHTPIHEARDACKQQLIDFKKQVENLEKQRNSLKRQHKKKTEEEEYGEEKAEEEVKRDTEEDTNRKDTPDKNASGKVFIECIHPRGDSHIKVTGVIVVPFRG